MIIGVLAGIIVGIYFIGVKTVEETRSLVDQAPEIYMEVKGEFENAGENICQADRRDAGQCTESHCGICRTELVPLPEKQWEKSVRLQ